jgi:hypothetical protein
MYASIEFPEELIPFQLHSAFISGALLQGYKNTSVISTCGPHFSIRRLETCHRVSASFSAISTMFPQL